MAGRQREDAAKVRIGFVRSADNEFKRLSAKIQKGLLSKLKAVALKPSLAKPLIGPLHGCCRVTYGRLRCVVRLADGMAVVLVMVVAQRKAGAKDDAYALATDYVASNRAAVDEILGRHIRAFLEENASAAERARKRP